MGFGPNAFLRGDVGYSTILNLDVLTSFLGICILQYLIVLIYAYELQFALFWWIFTSLLNCVVVTPILTEVLLIESFLRLLYKFLTSQLIYICHDLYYICCNPRFHFFYFYANFTSMLYFAECCILVVSCLESHTTQIIFCTQNISYSTMFSIIIK